MRVDRAIRRRRSNGSPHWARQLPGTIRFLRQLAADTSLPPGVRLRVGLVTVYLTLPFDRLRDFRADQRQRGRRRRRRP